MRFYALIPLALLPLAAAQEDARARQQSQDLFSKLDKNEDGKISREEGSDHPVRGLFARIDKDKDGFITSAEDVAFRMAWRARARSKQGQQQRPARPTPTHADLRYGPHERNVLDLFLAESTKPTPLVIYIHGGGFRGGNKNSINASMLSQLASKGVSMAAFNYRLSRSAPFPAQMHDCARALQFVRHHAKTYNIDPGRIAATGGSAGAGISQWLALRDDLADPASEDPISRQSTRLICAAPFNAQTSYDPRFIQELFDSKDVDDALVPFFGMKSKQDIHKPEFHPLFEESSPIHHASKDDPPLLIYFSQANKPLPPNNTGKQHIHHPKFGIVMKEKFDELGLECQVLFREDHPNGMPVAKFVSFFLEQFRAAETRSATTSRGTRNTDKRVANWLTQQDKNGDGKIARDEAIGQMLSNFKRNDTSKDGLLDRPELTALAEQLSRNAATRKRRPSESSRQSGNETRRRQSADRQTERQNKTRSAQTIRRVMPIEQLLKLAPEGVTLEADIPYREGNSEAWRLDLARPTDPGKKARPGIVFVHGGGWRNGDKRAGIFIGGAIEYAQKGYVCITVNYRLTDEAPFPACVEDVKCAVRWFRANAKKYNLDPTRIGGYGNSAGAHLVCMLGLTKPEAGLEGDGPFREQSSLLQAVCASATPTDFWLEREKWLRRGTKTGLLAGPADSLEERAKLASPITHVRADAPPFLLIHGTADTTVKVEHGDRFVAALRAAGAKTVIYRRIEGASHGVFNKHAKDTKPAMEAFFDSTIGKGSKK